MNLRAPRRRVALWCALVLLAVVTALVAFDEAWVRPWVQHKVRVASGRAIDFDSFRLGLDGSLQPRLRVTNLEIENAAWAKSNQPLIRARLFDVTFQWSSLWKGPLLITRLVLEDATLDLERQADGLRNWRVTRPEDRGPGRILVQSLDARNSRARIVQDGLGLDLELTSAPLPTARPGPGGDMLVKRLDYRGTRHGVAFEGGAAVGQVITFTGTDAWFAVDGDLKTARGRLTLQGRASDLMHLEALDAQVGVETGKLAELGQVLAGVALPFPELTTRANARIQRLEGAWQVTELQAHIGASDVAGQLRYAAHGQPRERTLQMALHSERLDLRPWRGQAREPRPTEPPRLDADIDWTVRQLVGLPVPVSNVQVRAVSRQGRWTLGPWSFAVGGGKVTGRGTLDAATSPWTGELSAQVTGVGLAAIGERLDGRLDATVNLKASGDTLKAMLASSDGTVSASLLGATLPASLEAKLGLDGGLWLRSLLAGDQRRSILCSNLQVSVTDGVGRIRRLVVETDRLAVEGTGAVDVGRRHVDLVLTPYRKQAALLALDKAVHVSGPFDQAKTGLVERRPGGRAVGCMAASQ